MANGEKGFGNINVKVLVCFILLALATIFQLAGLISDHWVDTINEEYGGRVGSSGLWRTCSTLVPLTNPCRGFLWTDNQVSHWFRTVQTLEVLGFVFGCVALFMMFLHTIVETCMENKRLKIISILLLSLSFVLVMCAGIVIGSLKDVQKTMTTDSTARLSWGFGISITASLIYLGSVVAIAIT